MIKELREGAWQSWKASEARHGGASHTSVNSSLLCLLLAVFLLFHLKASVGTFISELATCFFDIYQHFFSLVFYFIKSFILWFHSESWPGFLPGLFSNISALCLLPYARWPFSSPFIPHCVVCFSCGHYFCHNRIHISRISSLGPSSEWSKDEVEHGAEQPEL